MQMRTNTTNLRTASACAVALAAALALGGCAASAEPAASGTPGQATTAQEAPQDEQAASAETSDADGTHAQEGTGENAERDANAEGKTVERMLITVGTQSFTVSLEDNEAARAFAAMLPLELDMRDVNGNEKFAELADALPTDSFAPGRIETGDLMLYGGDGVVLFYESFDSPYSYTRLGRVDDPSALATIADADSIHATFERA